MALYESIALIPELPGHHVHAESRRCVQHPGRRAAVGRLAFLLSMSCTAVIVLLVLIARSERVSINSIAFALILAGATGNLIDRAT